MFFYNNYHACKISLHKCIGDMQTVNEFNSGSGRRTIKICVQRIDSKLLAVLPWILFGDVCHTNSVLSILGLYIWHVHKLYCFLLCAVCMSKSSKRIKSIFKLCSYFNEIIIVLKGSSVFELISLSLHLSAFIWKLLLWCQSNVMKINQIPLPWSCHAAPFEESATYLLETEWSTEGAHERLGDHRHCSAISGYSECHCEGVVWNLNFQLTFQLP